LTIFLNIFRGLDLKKFSFGIFSEGFTPHGMCIQNFKSLAHLSYPSGQERLATKNSLKNFLTVCDFLFDIKLEPFKE
jgi:hypothetical protein